MLTNSSSQGALALEVLNILPNPVLVKDADLRYVSVNAAFERLFGVRSAELVGKFDVDVFAERQATQCNGGDLRVLDTGEVDESHETVIDPEQGDRMMITRKSRLIVDGEIYLVGVMHDITDVSTANKLLAESTRLLEEQAEALQVMADTDGLTGCLNRRALGEVVQQTELPDEVGLILIDIDHFKAVNDVHGHAAGDAALRHISELVSAVIRPHDVLSRVGGEEFAVFLPNASQSESYAVAERVRSVVASSQFFFKNAPIPLTISAGFVHTGAPSADQLDEWLAEADVGLYAAKAGGRNMVSQG